MRRIICVLSTTCAEVVQYLTKSICVACSAELLKIWNEREAALVAEEGTAAEKTLCGCLATRPLAVST